MRRRDFVTVLAGATAWISTAGAQESRWVIGILSSIAPNSYPELDAGLIRGLENTGFIEGKNISIIRRWVDGQYDRLPSLASELVRRGVAVIICYDAPAAFAAKATSSITPIVFTIGTDPVKIGLVDRFNRPAGNITGVYNLLTGLTSKHLELLHDLLPAARTIALLVNPNNPNHVYVPETLAAANALGFHLEVLTASAEGDLEAAFKIMVQQRADALVMIADPFFIIARREQFVALAAGSATPAIYPFRWFADVGGLMSYGASIPDLVQLVGTYVGKILRGAKPADLPIQQSTKVELVINLKTAKTLGLTVPPELLARADEVIE
jgi:putative tryptophan/tyrosine transport system substrate-binding protein